MFLEVVEIAADRRTPVGPSRPIHWKSGPEPAGRAPEERPPNIVLILADDLGWTALGDKSDLHETPHLDRLAREGMRLTDAHSPSAVCTPTRYGVLTGRYAWRTRLKQGVLGGESTNLIALERVTLPELLRERGEEDLERAVEEDEAGNPIIKFAHHHHHYHPTSPSPFTSPLPSPSPLDYFSNRFRNLESHHPL